MKSLPLVSILIPAFNARFFTRALVGALSQSYGNVEVIVCDDSRANEIKDIVDSFEGSGPVPLRYVRNPTQLGMVGNLQACLAQANGEYIKFLCDDDQLFPACIEKQAQAFIDHADVNLVLAQRMFWDADDYQLPARLENSPLAHVSGLYKGEDLLSIFENFPVNFLGGFTNALFRHSDLLELLPALTQPGHCFLASLDFALYICLLRRGNMAVLDNVVSIERLYPGRLIRQQHMRDAALNERSWMVQMLKARSGEPAPARGWVRYVPLTQADETPRVWKELPLSRTLGTKQSTQIWRVGIELKASPSCMRIGWGAAPCRNRCASCCPTPWPVGRASRKSSRSSSMIGSMAGPAAPACRSLSKAWSNSCIPRIWCWCCPALAASRCWKTGYSRCRCKWIGNSNSMTS